MGGNIEEFHDKATKKKLRNRLSAQRARDRQKARMRILEMEVLYLTRRNLAIKKENEWMKTFLDNAANGSPPGVGPSPCHRRGTTNVRCRQPHCGRVRSNSSEVSTTENHEGIPATGGTQGQNPGYALQPLQPFFHRHHIPGSSMSLPPGFVQMFGPWGRLTRLPAMLLDDRVINSARKEDTKPEPVDEIDRDEQDCDLEDENDYQSLANQLADGMVASDDSSYTESSDEDSDEADEEESVDE